MRLVCQKASDGLGYATEILQCFLEAVAVLLGSAMPRAPREESLRCLVEASAAITGSQLYWRSSVEAREIMWY